MWIVCHPNSRWTADSARLVNLAAIEMLIIAPSPVDKDGELYRLYAQIQGESTYVCEGSLENCHKALQQILAASGQPVKYLDV